MNRFVISDLHLDDKNIIKYCKRPFKDEKEMNEALIENWNSVVNDGDMVINIGDLSCHRASDLEWYKNILSRLNGRHILILGNHDVLKPFDYVNCGIESVHTSLVIDDVFLAHDPVLANVIPEDTIMFCGHAHNLFKRLITTRLEKVLNMSCELWDYKPVEWQEAIDYINFK